MNGDDEQTPQELPGVIEIVRADPEADVTPGGKDEAQDLFAAEEHPRRLILCTLYDDDARDLVDLLERQGVGARLGHREPDGTTQILIHDIRLPEAQATLADFLGTDEPLEEPVEAADDATDPGAAPNAWGQANTEVWGDPGPSPGSQGNPDPEATDDEFVLVMSTGLADAHHQAARLSAEGIDVKIWMPNEAVETDPSLRVDLLVASDDLDDARRLLGLVL